MGTRLRVYTSRYGNTGLARAGFVCVGIARFSPRFKLAFPLRANLPILAPTATMLAQARNGQLTPRQFRAQYIHQLDQIGVENILKALKQLQGSRRAVVLLCYEPAGQRCHRRYVSSWLRARAGLDVRELPDLGGPPARSRPSKRPRQLDLFRTTEDP